MAWQSSLFSIKTKCRVQPAKKVLSDSPGLDDFAIGLVNSVFNLPDRQVMFLCCYKNELKIKFLEHLIAFN